MTAAIFRAKGKQWTEGPQGKVADDATGIGLLRREYIKRRKQQRRSIQQKTDHNQ
jgi:hypothetical protein